MEICDYIITEERRRRCNGSIGGSWCPWGSTDPGDDSERILVPLNLRYPYCACPDTSWVSVCTEVIHPLECLNTTGEDLILAVLIWKLNSTSILLPKRTTTVVHLKTNLNLCTEKINGRTSISRRKKCLKISVLSKVCVSSLSVKGIQEHWCTWLFEILAILMARWFFPE